MTLPLALRLEKNKLISTAPWLVFVAITLPDTSVIRIVKNTEDVTFGGNVYTAFAFELGDQRASGDGKVQSLSLRVANPARAFTPYLEEYEGLVGCSLVLSLVHADNLGSDYTDLILNWEIMATTVPDEEWIEFTLGAESPIRRRFPLYVITPLSCNWLFKGVECAYAGVATTCDRTLDNCRTLNNSGRFGGRPGVLGAPRFVG